MNKLEVSKLFSIICVEHPKFPATEERATVWAEQLKHVPYSVAERAVMVLLTQNPFEPKLADIVKTICSLRVPSGPQLTAAEAYDRAVWAARECYNRGDGTPLNEVPPAIKRTIKALGLWEVSRASGDTFRAQFLKAYDECLQQEQRAQLEAVTAPPALPTPERKRLQVVSSEVPQQQVEIGREQASNVLAEIGEVLKKRENTR